MEKTFEYNGVQAKAYWNGQDYKGVRYVKVHFAGSKSSTDMIWTNDRGWTKNGGYDWAPTVAKILGFLMKEKTMFQVNLKYRDHDGVHGQIVQERFPSLEDAREYAKNDLGDEYFQANIQEYAPSGEWLREVEIIEK